ncbi:hypothetical protein PMAYCL1PPCAC_17456, partial [Pristionchus mayeri]
FIMYSWSIAFLIGIIAHTLYIICDFNSTYLPLHYDDPPYRLMILGLHGFSHVLSSTQEFLFAVDRAVASSYPLRYHDDTMSVKALFLGETLSV